jgi:predicted RNA binding protein YcfA (HicA-like mRNA interferase family)
MSNKIINEILSGLKDNNIKFTDLRNVILNLGFYERIKGDHYIYTKTDIIEIINIQPRHDGKAKNYQVKQIRNIILKYKLHKEDFNV